MAASARLNFPPHPVSVAPRILPTPGSGPLYGGNHGICRHSALELWRVKAVVVVVIMLEIVRAAEGCFLRRRRL
tara:strand:+ start:92 stop:313 length:222 start_codon:yes stop_codon:yes gene_type:complete